MPRGTYWRPLENIVFWLAGFANDGRVVICHLAAFFGHVAAIGILCALLGTIGVSRSAALLAAGLVAVHPANAAAVWSVDSNNQTWSTAFGLLACLLALKEQKRWWVVSAMVASLWKESGIAWFAAVPVLCVMIEAFRGTEPTELKARFWANRGWFATGLVGAMLYLAARFALSGHMSLGAASGRYAFGYNPVVWAKNAALLLGVVVVPADTVAIFGRAHSLVAGLLPALLAVPFLVVAARELGRAVLGRVFWPWLACLMLAALMAPHIFIGHVSEMYAHPFTLAATVPLCLLFRTRWRGSARAVIVLLAPLLFAFLLVDVSKFREMLATTRLGKAFARRSGALLEPYRKDGICFIPEDYRSWPGGYSVFQMDQGSAAGWGKALVLEWGWERYDAIVVDRLPAECSANLRRMRVGRDGSLRDAK